MFTQDTFATVGAQSANTPTIFSYKSTDTIAQIKATDYFIDKSLQLEAGDFIMVVASDAGDILEVQSDRSTASIFLEMSILNQNELPSTPGAVNFDPVKSTMNVRNIFTGSSIQVGQESVVFGGI